MFRTAESLNKLNEDLRVNEIQVPVTLVIDVPC